ncbi:MAG: pirin family protein [Aquisalimonadaceae bacterium]
MINIRKGDARGTSRAGWLHSRHSFSFADYYDPAHMGVSALRVLNEDRVDPGEGFPPHGHRDMEIISIVLEGAMAHEDSTGGGSVIRPGDVQLMHAGTGIMHSEFNASDTDPLHFLQIWVMPNRTGVRPGYEQHQFMEPDEHGVMRRILDPDGAEGALRINQDVRAWQARLTDGQDLDLPLSPGRQGWLQVAKGDVLLDGETLTAGDGAHIQDTGVPVIHARGDAELIVFDLP